MGLRKRRGIHGRWLKPWEPDVPDRWPYKPLTLEKLALRYIPRHDGIMGMLVAPTAFLAGIGDKGEKHK